jgi:hypothetical protein
MLTGIGQRATHVCVLLALTQAAWAQEAARHRIDKTDVRSLAVAADPASDAKERSDRNALSEWTARQGEKRVGNGRVQTANASPDRVGAETVSGVLSLREVRFFADFSGDTVVVGEVQNNTLTTLSFAQARFLFFGSSGFPVGVDENYVFGSQNSRLLASGLFTNVLPPGAVGFFKVWTDIPFASVYSYSFSSTAETYLTTPPRAALAVSGPITLSPNVLGGTDYTFVVRNSGVGVTTYFSQVYLAGYVGGRINDVDFSYARGNAVTRCGVTTETAIDAGGLGLVDSFFLRPVTSIGHLAFEWDEVAVSPSAVLAPAAGHVGSIHVFAQCSWTATSNVDWIAVTAGAAGSRDGTLSFVIAPNTTGAARSGSLTIAGLVVAVEQAAAATAPAISGHPLHSSVFSGSSITLAVTATGTEPLTYQWFIGMSEDTSQPVAGATAALYTTPPLIATTGYWVRVSNVAGSADSNIAVVSVQPRPFTDPTLSSGLSMIRDLHVNELRARIQALRLRFGLPLYEWTDAVLTPGATPIRTVHITELRHAVEQVYIQAGKSAPAYTDPELIPGVTLAKAAHITELRVAVIALE